MGPGGYLTPPGLFVSACAWERPAIRTGFRSETGLKRVSTAGNPTNSTLFPCECEKNVTHRALCWDFTGGDSAYYI